MNGTFSDVLLQVLQYIQDQYPEQQQSPSHCSSPHFYLASLKIQPGELQTDKPREIRNQTFPDSEKHEHNQLQTLHYFTPPWKRTLSMLKSKPGCELWEHKRTRGSQGCAGMEPGVQSTPGFTQRWLCSATAREEEQMERDQQLEGISSFKNHICYFFDMISPARHWTAVWVTGYPLFVRGNSAEFLPDASSHSPGAALLFAG